MNTCVLQNMSNILQSTMVMFGRKQSAAYQEYLVHDIIILFDIMKHICSSMTLTNLMHHHEV